MKKRAEAIYVVLFLGFLSAQILSEEILAARGKCMNVLLFSACIILLLLFDKFEKKIFLYGIHSILVFLQMEWCNYNTFELMIWKYAVIEMIVIFLMFVIVDLLLNHYFITSVSLSILYFIVAIINSYVYVFRKIPLVPTDFELTKTAIAVLDHYTISMTRQVMAGIIFFIINISVSCCFYKRRRGSKKRNVWTIIKVLLTVAVIRLPFSDAVKPIIDITTVAWNVQYGYWQYGYLLGSVNNLKEIKIEKPDSYKNIDEVINDVEKADVISKKEYPDIILIVNESWYDLQSVSNIKTSQKSMEYIDSLTNVKRGYVVNPNTVTANSEYEILTSNSIQLLSSVTAFTHFSLKDINSIAKNLREINYETYAIHPAPEENYNRSVSYPELGFQELTWITDFPEKYSFVRDYPSDEACFDKIIELYEKSEQNGKNKFIYNLTLQNHGNYDRGINKFIKVLGGIDETQFALAEEYLNSIHYTDKAFLKLTEYFRNIDKPVIICMLGDHSPNFTSDVANKEFSCEEEKTVKMKSTPFILWSNYPIEDEDFGYSSMIYVAPMLFKAAGLPLTGYQKYLLQMQEVWPIVTVGICGDGENYYSYEGADFPNRVWLENYFAMEYNNIIGNEKDFPGIYDYHR